MSPRLATVVVSAFAAVLAAIVVPACSNMAEGERCDVRSDNAGNDDCQDGLRCTPKSELTGAQSDICCPPARASATTAICAQAPSPGGNVPPTDSGAADTSQAQDTSVQDTGVVTDSGTDAFDAADSE
ncbi:MAG: hypothetical protein JWM74_2456 [Myxococcaceae bacterium]|nr:hypothetical protein [Myxococcaceae bacterium]